MYLPVISKMIIGNFLFLSFRIVWSGKINVIFPHIIMDVITICPHLIALNSAGTVFRGIINVLVGIDRLLSYVATPRPLCRLLIITGPKIYASPE